MRNTIYIIYRLVLDPAIHKFGTSVNVSNMMKTILMSMVELYISCANHTQQLTIHDTFKRVKNDDDLDTISEIADKCKLLANHLKKVLGYHLLQLGW